MAELASQLLQIERDNLVARPWGGDWIKRFKRVAPEAQAQAPRWGEAFEISAFDADAEASQYPSLVRLDDGSQVKLPALLEAQAEALLGDAFVGRHGRCFPLLPKTLCVKELLSVQGHPAGHTEVYIIIDAEPGATLRLGFSRDIDAAEITRELTRGIERQRELLDLLGSDVDTPRVQQLVAPWFAARDADMQALMHWLEEQAPDRAKEAAALLAGLKKLYWQVLDSMNAIPVAPGQVIYNATPQRLLSATGRVASAEVHALGNPEGREILALEIRRPGPTFRAWDNVRFPVREVGVQDAIKALNLSATRPEEFVAERRAVAGRHGTYVSVDCEYFRVEHLVPDASSPVDVPQSDPHSLHCLAGSVTLSVAGGRVIGRLEHGESALVPVGVGAYRVAADAPADVVRVCLPAN
jgi:mannose-6-phosphate isomerase class I